MRFVPLKTVEQQAVLALHQVRQGFVRAPPAQANQIRGLLGEFGLIVPQGIGHIATRVPDLIEDGANELPGAFRTHIQRLLEHLKELDCHSRKSKKRSMHGTAAAISAVSWPWFWASAPSPPARWSHRSEMPRTSMVVGRSRPGSAWSHGSTHRAQ
jgi:transposase